MILSQVGSTTSPFILSTISGRARYQNRKWPRRFFLPPLPQNKQSDTGLFTPKRKLPALKRRMWHLATLTSTSPVIINPISLVPIFGVTMTSPTANVAGFKRGSTTRTKPVTWKEVIQDVQAMRRTHGDEPVVDQRRKQMAPQRRSVSGDWNPILRFLGGRGLTRTLGVFLVRLSCLSPVDPLR